jgi:hypothetical protein
MQCHKLCSSSFSHKGTIFSHPFQIVVADTVFFVENTSTVPKFCPSYYCTREGIWAQVIEGIEVFLQLIRFLLQRLTIMVRAKGSDIPAKRTR